MQKAEMGRWVYSIGKHLRVFAQDARTTHLYATTSAYACGDFLFRIRGLQAVPAERVKRVAMEAGLPRQELKNWLERLESIGVIHCDYLASGELDKVIDLMLSEDFVFRAIADVFTHLDPSPEELAFLPMIQLLSQLPHKPGELIQALSQDHEQQAVEKAIELQEAFGLLRKMHVPDHRTDLLFNEYMWGQKIDKIAKVVAGLGTQDSSEVKTLMDEVRNKQGVPLEELQSVSHKIKELASRTGILDTTTIITATGDKKTFTFNPFFYGYKAGRQMAQYADDSDHVKLFIASITYGVKYSPDFNLNLPLKFVQVLLRDGEAGKATPILRDYPLLEKHGIVDVYEYSPGRGRFLLRKKDIVQQALDVMSGGHLDLETKAEELRIAEQTAFQCPEQNRLQLGQNAGPTGRFEHDTIASIRDLVDGGSWL